MHVPQRGQVNAPKIVLDDVIEFSKLPSRLRFAHRDDPEQYIEFDYHLIDSVFDGEGNVLHGGAGCPVETDEPGLQIAFSSQVKYLGKDRAHWFELTGGRAYFDNQPMENLNIGYGWVKGLYDGDGIPIWPSSQD